MMHDMAFTQLIESWHPFYAAVTTASATLTGLLFFSLTYNGAIIERKGNDHLHRLAEQALSNFIIVMVIGLLFLIPHPNAASLGLPILALAMYSAFRSAVRLWQQHRHVDNTPYLYWRFITSLICSVILIGFSEDLLRQESITFFWLTAVVIMFIISTCTDAWFLLMEIPREAPQNVSGRKFVTSVVKQLKKK